MQPTVSLLIAFIVVFHLVVVGLLFNHNMPQWCATPEVGHNYLIQPFCN